MMRRQVIPSLLLALTATGAHARSDLPRTGDCVHRENAGGTILRTLIRWSGQDAEITTTYGETIPGQVVGLRPHDENFKLSILFDEPVSGPSEMTIFGVTMDGVTRHRRAIVAYETLQDGARVVNYVKGFDDIDCAVLE
ncbi:MAG: hypothetical protein ACE369_02070 [Roseovarius sp.]